MSVIIFLETLAVLAAWIVVGYMIWKWGPGLRRRTVRCPESHQRAGVKAAQREAEFGCLRVVDIHQCSLSPSRNLSCSKACMARL